MSFGSRGDQPTWPVRGDKVSLTSLDYYLPAWPSRLCCWSVMLWSFEHLTASKRWNPFLCMFVKAHLDGKDSSEFSSVWVRLRKLRNNYAKVDAFWKACWDALGAWHTQPQLPSLLSRKLHRRLALSWPTLDCLISLWKWARLPVAWQEESSLKLRVE